MIRTRARSSAADRSRHACRRRRRLASLPYHAADASRPTEPRPRAPDPRRRRRRQDRPAGAHLPRARRLRASSRRPTGRPRSTPSRRHRPALVVLDLMLPELDGRAVIRAVRRDDEAAATPILIVLGARLDPRPDRRPRGRRRRLPAEAVLAGRARPARQVDPAPDGRARRRPDAAAPAAARCHGDLSSTSTATRSPGPASRSP